MRRFLLIGAWAVALALSPPPSAQEPSSTLKDIVDPAQALPRGLPDSAGAAETEPLTDDAVRLANLVLHVSELMVVRLEGTFGPSSADRLLLDQAPPGAVILPRLMGAESTAQYVTDLRARKPSNPSRVPVMIGVDFMFASEPQAGTGSEPRPGNPFRVPAMLTTAAAGPSDATAALYRTQASDLATVGADFHWGPSLALATRLDEIPGTLNTFGALPDVAAELAGQFGHALQQERIAWAATGFPGGARLRNERGPAVLVTPRSQLRAMDLKPYEAAIAAGAGMIHVGTALVPTLDASKPACLSPIVIRDVLRDALGFDGLVIAGPMDSPDVSRISETSTAAVEALMSGADMIYWSSSGPRVARAIVDIVQAVQVGAIPEALVERAYQRVVAYKDKLGVAAKAAPDLGDARKLDKAIAKRTESGEIERRAITLLRNRGDILPLTEEGSGMVGVTGAYGVDELKKALEEYMKPVAAQAIRTARHAGRIQAFEIDRLTRPGSPVKVAVAIFADDIALAGQLELIRRLRRNGQRVVVVLVGIPNNLSAYEDADAVIAAYGRAQNTADTMVALADVLVGLAPVQVLPPLRPLELRAGEPATFDVRDVVRSPVGRLPVTVEPPFVAGYGVSYRPVTTLDDVSWDFGDGKRSRDPVATHQYADPGTYDITLRVGKKASTSQGTFRVVVK